MLWKKEGAGEGAGGEGDGGGGGRGEAVGVAYLPFLGRRAEGRLGGGDGPGGTGRVGSLGCQTSVAAETPPVSLSTTVLSR